MEGLPRTVPGLHHVMSNFVIEIDGESLSREDVVTAHALQVPYFEQHG